MVYRSFQQLCIILIFLCGAQAAWGETLNPSSLSTIEFDQPIHFLTADGSDVLLQPGEYQVVEAEEWLKFIPIGAEQKDALLISADSATHEQSQPLPRVQAEPGENADWQHITLFLPNGQSLEATGTYSGIRPRAISKFRFKGRTKPSRAKRVTRIKKSPQSKAATLSRGKTDIALRHVHDVPYFFPKRPPVKPFKRKLEDTEPLYTQPYFANDLPPGRRILRGKKIHSASGSQQWGYDLGAMQYSSKTGKWSDVKPGTDWKKIKNSNYYIDNTPVYAMGPGTIIRCWRNAPENPRPFSKALGDDFKDAFKDRNWLHQAWRDKKMSGGGNHLLVEEDDGDMILYAHAKPGTISTKLCPNNKTLYSKSDASSEADVSKAKQVRIKAGQYLYRTGNSGNSSAPHLHVHLQTSSGTSKLLRFSRGLSTPLKSGREANINQWTRFAGNRIPDGPVLVWPPRKRSTEYARHGFPAKDFQRMFAHLSDSGFWPEWIDGYSVAGKPYLNFVWRPAKGSWRAFFLLNSSDYQKEFNKAKNDNYRPVFVESSLSEGKIRYTVIFVKNKPGGYLAKHGLTYNQHMSEMNAAKKSGLYPVNISVVSVSGKRYYTVLYRSENIGRWQVKSQIPTSTYQQLYNANSQAKRKPLYVNAYMHKGQSYYSVIFSERPKGGRKDQHGMTKQQYQSEYNSALKSKIWTRAVSGYDGAKKNHRFAAIWRK
jgi:hypothetical protein